MTQNMFAKCALSAGAIALSFEASALAQGQFSSRDPDIRQFSARPADPRPPKPKVLYDEVFVVSNPTKGNEARTVKEAYNKLKNRGAIFITQENSDLSDDGQPFIISKAFKLDIDSRLREQMLKEGKKGRSQRVTLNAGSDGTCFTVDQSARANQASRGVPEFGVIIRDIDIVPNPTKATTCINVKAGELFLNNVRIKNSADFFFERAIEMSSGLISMNDGFSADVSDDGAILYGGSMDVVSRDASFFRTLEDGAPLSDVSGHCAKNAPSNKAVGLFIGAVNDARKGSPKTSGKIIIDGFDYGVCARGDGAILSDGSKINSNGVGVSALAAIDITGADIQNNINGVLAKAPITVRNSDISGNADAGLVLEHPEGEFVENDISSNRRGVVAYFDEEYAESLQPLGIFWPLDRRKWRDMKFDNSGNAHPPVIHRNFIVFNGVGIGLKAKRSLENEEVYDFMYGVDVTGNTVACNIDAGNVAEMKRFRQRNISRKENAERFCARDVRDDFCQRIQDKRYFKPVPGRSGDPVCGGLAELRDNRASTIASRVHGWFVGAGQSSRSPGVPAMKTRLSQFGEKGQGDARDYVLGVLENGGIRKSHSRREVKSTVKSSYRNALAQLKGDPSKVSVSAPSIPGGAVTPPVQQSSQSTALKKTPKAKQSKAPAETNAPQVQEPQPQILPGQATDQTAVKKEAEQALTTPVQRTGSMTIAKESCQLECSVGEGDRMCWGTNGDKVIAKFKLRDYKKIGAKACMDRTEIDETCFDARSRLDPSSGMGGGISLDFSSGDTAPKTEDTLKYNMKCSL